MPQTFFPETFENLSLFHGLSEKERQGLLQQGLPRWYSRGQYIFRHGEPLKYFYIICSGTLQLSRETPGGVEITIDILGAGQTLCKQEIFQLPARAHQVSALTVNDALVLEFPAAWLKEAARNPIIALNILSAISYYAHMGEVEADKITMTASQQIACFLQHLCITYALDPVGFDLPCSKALIASRLGMKPETFSRALATLRQNGIDVEDSRVSFRHVASLHDYVCGHCSIIDSCQTYKAMQASGK
jgi:CRP/FNR family transcriptional regulator, dissimilatory nitrate respiration regulator